MKVNAPENRKVCRDLRVAGLPAYLTMRDGVEVERLTGNGTTPEQIEGAIERLLDGAPAVGPPVPEHLRQATDEYGRRDEGGEQMELGARRSSPSANGTACPARRSPRWRASAGAEVIEVRTECFV